MNNIYVLEVNSEVRFFVSIAKGRYSLTIFKETRFMFGSLNVQYEN